MNKQSGFTLMEMLLSVAMLGILAAASIPLYRSFQVQNDLSTATTIYAHTARRAQALSFSGELDDTWGVYTSTGTVVMFRGASYAARDTDYDELFDIADTIVLSGDTEYVFSKLTGYPDAAGTLTMTSVDGDSATVSINEKGMISH